MHSLSQPNGTNSAPWILRVSVTSWLTPVVVDLRNVYRPMEMARFGFAYSCVGKSSVGKSSSASHRRR